MGDEATAGAAPADSIPKTYERVSDMAALDRWIALIRDRGYVAVDTETTSLDEIRAELVGVSLCVEAGSACYIPLGHKAGAADDLFGSDALAEGQMPMEQALALLGPVLEDPEILKIGQNMKYDAKILARHGIEVAPIDDTMLMSYALNAGLHGHGMDALSERYLGHEPIAIKTLLGGGKSAITFDRVPIDEATKYAAEDADITLRLAQLFQPQLHRAQVTTVYETLERPLVPVLARMEMARHQGGPRHAQPHVQCLRAENGGAGGRDPRTGGRDVQRRQPCATGRDPVRQDGPGGRQEGQDRGLCHRRRCAGGSGDRA